MHISTTDSPQPVTDTERRDLIAGLRGLADFLEQHPEFPNLTVPFDFKPYALCHTAEAFAAAVSMLGGERHKDTDDDFFNVVRNFGGPIALEVCAARHRVCERRVVGQREVEVEEVVTPAVTRKVTRVEDVVEWECSPILSGAAAKEKIGEARQALTDARAEALQ